MKRRAIISRSEGAGHPFRQMLAPAMLSIEVAEEKPAKWWKQEDIHLFAMSFIAFFIVFYTFIA
ncbi:MAG: hypothetical protein V3V15_03855 [Sphingorhabdus sp.]